LKAEIEKDRRLLEEDKKELRQLEKALKDEEVRRKRHNKGLHPLAVIGEGDTVRLRPIEETLRLPYNTRPPLRDLDKDASLGNLLEQLHNHLESLQNNTSNIQGVPSAMATARAALDCFSWQCLGKEKYSKLHGLEVT
jgi:kinetochore protein Fta7